MMQAFVQRGIENPAKSPCTLAGFLPLRMVLMTCLASERSVFLFIFRIPLTLYPSKIRGLYHPFSRVAQDILAIQGFSIAVERLFSSMKHILTNDRTSMALENSLMCIVTKERLKSGLCERLNSAAAGVGRESMWTEVLNIHEY
jgi:hypothetical protein